MGKLLLWIGLFLAACLSAQTISLENFVSGISNPVEIVASPTSDNRLFVVQQSGTIKIVNESGTVASDNFLNISSLVTFNGERGLLGLAFHPQFSTNRYFFVYYNNLQGDIRVSRFTANSTNPNIADASSEKILLTIPKPFTNHNGGSIHFGADGYLWISTGDGGSSGDPNNNSQNKNSLLGKMLRIDINTDNAYNIPSDNPFVGVDGADEIWAYGLRNAWKFSFDRTTNQVWIADVGQGNIEEINKVSATTPGINYGWRCYEGNDPYNTTGCANTSTMTFPIAQYDHSGGKCSITGGYLYRGTLYSDLVGKYVFADYCSAQIGILDSSNTITWTSAFSGNNFTTFGEDNQKQIYIASSGTIYKIKTNNLAVSDINKSNILITPNPAKEKIYLQNLSDRNISAEIMDLTGRIVHQVQISDNDNSIDVSKLQQGTYLLNLKKDNQKWISKKFIKE